MTSEIIIDLKDSHYFVSIRTKAAWERCVFSYNSNKMLMIAPILSSCRLSLPLMSGFLGAHRPPTLMRGSVPVLHQLLGKNPGWHRYLSFPWASLLLQRLYTSSTSLYVFPLLFCSKHQLNTERDLTIFWTNVILSFWLLPRGNCLCSIIVSDSTSII